MSNYLYIAWIPLLPLAGFVILGLFGRKYFGKFSGVLGTCLLLVTTLLSLYVAYLYFFGGVFSGEGVLGGSFSGVGGITAGKVAGETYRMIEVCRINWLNFSPGISIDMGIILDPISVMMIVIVSFVSLMVHIFSLGYMKGEERFATYYAFLSLFTFSMLGLVLSGNIFQTYIFWELVGVSSYLLIGYYFDKPAAVAASKKAFIVTRFADLGFLVGVLILAFYGGTLDFSTLIHRLTTAGSSQLVSITTASFLGFSMLSWGLTLVFIGGAGKSAMFPLHIWLPDAMEGPTPVSALIHAATMVVAGVYLVARLFPIYSLSDPGVLKLVTYVGALSALLAAIIACTQTDIKRVLAYSTMSQIGYMMFALGVSKYGGEAGLGYMASMFHLWTHAFFKSLLFLGAGAVIHFVHSNEMKDMGAMRKLLPVTHVCFLIACLAIAGIPPFSGFFSKEEILTAAWRSDRLIYAVGLFTSGLTAFYMFRLYFSIFWRKGESHGDAHIAGTGKETITEQAVNGLSHSHDGNEGPLTMKIPLVILAVCTVLTGFLPFSQWVTSDGAPLDTHVNMLFSIAPVAFALVGIFFAAGMYRKENDRAEKVAANFGGLYRAAYRKFYMDEVYLFITKKIIFNGIGRPAAWIDKHIVDGFMNWLASFTAGVSAMIKGFQSGKVQSYALYFLAGIAGLTILFIYLRN
jgi:NADH-quinone oxidoreductase subunit L